MFAIVWFVKKRWKKIFKILVIIFAIIGVSFTAVFIAMQFGWLNVRGSTTARNTFFATVPKTDNSNNCLDIAGKKMDPSATCDWEQSAEWQVVHDGFVKDSAVINQVATQTGVSARMIVAVTAPEQLRYFTSNRESFKRYYEPLKILGSLSKFSLGVSGIKQDTANKIEQYAHDPNSEFYPGVGMSDLIAYQPTDVHDTVLYDRLTDAHNHYYSYLYTALFIKEIESQWQKSGFDVVQTPQVIVTLFNIGFNASHPNANPQIAGSDITLGGKTYAFGELGTLFYTSDQLTTQFPK